MNFLGYSAQYILGDVLRKKNSAYYIQDTVAPIDAEHFAWILYTIYSVPSYAPFDENRIVSEISVASLLCFERDLTIRSSN